MLHRVTDSFSACLKILLLVLSSSLVVYPKVSNSPSPPVHRGEGPRETRRAEDQKDDQDIDSYESEVWITKTLGVHLIRSKHINTVVWPRCTTVMNIMKSPRLLQRQGRVVHLG